MAPSISRGATFQQYVDDLHQQEYSREQLTREDNASAGPNDLAEVSLNRKYSNESVKFASNVSSGLAKKRRMSNTRQGNVKIVFYDNNGQLVEKKMNLY